MGSVLPPLFLWAEVDPVSARLVSRRPLLVGESPGRHFSVPKLHRPLWPWPRNAAGDRLRRYMGLDDVTYVRRTDRTNVLYTEAWEKDVARQVALTLVYANLGRPVLLMGRKVQAAFQLPPDARDFAVYEMAGMGFYAMAVPHPSGRSRSWNDPAKVHDFRVALCAFTDLPVGPAATALRRGGAR